MNDTFREIVWLQFGAAIDMLENAVLACPDDLWSDRSRQPEYWYVVFHTLFWLDYYLSESPESFAPPPPFTLDELDPAGILPERPYDKGELLRYLVHGRSRCRATIEDLTEERATRPVAFRWGQMPFDELLLYTLRHVQHHAAQLNLLLRQATDSSPGWVSRARD